MNPQIITWILSLLSLCLVLYYNSKNEKRADSANVKGSAVEMATLNVKLDNIGTDVRDIKYDIGTVKVEVKNLSDKSIKMEASLKSAWRTIDEIKGMKSEENEGV